MKNTKQGVNPVTGKEYLILQKVGNKLTKITSYQTRYGAEQNKASGQSIVLKEKLKEKLDGLKNNKKQLLKELEEIRHRIEKANKYLKNVIGGEEEASVRADISSFKEIQRITEVALKEVIDFSEIEKLV